MRSRRTGALSDPRGRGNAVPACHCTTSAAGPTPDRPDRRPADALSVENAAFLADTFAETIEPCPPIFRGRGIVTCAGGARYNTCAWVLVKMLRRLGCTLPVQVWHLGPSERDESWIAAIKPLGVDCVDAHVVRRRYPHDRLSGWPLKPYAMLHSPFSEVLFLDADNVPVADPTYLFADPAYRATGAMFWPDGLRTPRSSRRWKIFGVPYRDEWEQESGQILVDKRRCWKELSLCDWYNRNAHFFYRFVYGDKDTFRFAWHRLGRPFAMPDRPITMLPHTLCQHDPAGRRIFQHRCGAKWTLGANRRVPGFRHEADCLVAIEELRRRWEPGMQYRKRMTAADRERMKTLAGARFAFLRHGHNRWPLQLAPGSAIARGRCETCFRWWVEEDCLVLAGADGQPRWRLVEKTGGGWRGRGLKEKRMAVELAPL
ncbi:MAG: hypothetical protein HQ581_14680 [Planctomycetes bacterium]|nr:hypothetical protein [Planctomycetota bacterium]